ncbi:MAG TPA: rhodanese-like domain-containing protein, partial [bacterium]
MSTSTKINKSSTMQEVLDAYPSAQRALFQKYHIGGCHSCGYEPTDILETVAAKHNITDINEVLAFIEEAEQIDKRTQATPAEVALVLKSANPPQLIDVRGPQEWEMAKIPGAELMTENLSYEIMNSPKDRPMVFYCHKGQRSMDAAAYFTGHGFINVKSMTGGIDAWSQSIDPSIPRYEAVRNLNTGRPEIRPLRSVVSNAEGC